MRFSVQLDDRPLDADPAQPRVAGRPIHDDAVRIHQRDVEVVQERIGRAPQAAAILGHQQIERRIEVRSQAAGRHGDDALPVAQDRAELRAGRRADYRRLHPKLASADVRRDARTAQPHVRHRLHPHRLPDAGGARVHAAVVLVARRLLARWLGATARIARPHDDGGRLTSLRDPRQVAGDRREAAAMARHLDAVDPDGRVVIHRLEMEQHVPARPLRRDRDCASIPDGVHPVGVADAGEGRLRAEGYDDALGKLALGQAAFQAAVARIDLELPFTVQAQPIVAHELRTGVFRAGDAFGHGGHSLRRSRPGQALRMFI